MNRIRRIGAICVVSMLGLSGAVAGDFVTPEVASSDRSVPVCSSKLGCLLQGTKLPDYGAEVMPRSEPLLRDPTVSARAPRIATSSKRLLSRPTAVASSHSGRSKLAFVRVLTRTDITSFQALAGRPVSLGLGPQDGQAAGRAVFKQFGVKIAETPLDVDNALDGLASGDVAAVVITRPDQASRLRNLKSTTLHFLSVPSGSSAPAGMRLARLPDTEAPAISHGKAVVTFAVEAELLRHLSRRELASSE